MYCIGRCVAGSQKLASNQMSLNPVPAIGRVTMAPAMAEWMPHDNPDDIKPRENEITIKCHKMKTGLSGGAERIILKRRMNSTTRFITFANAIYKRCCDAKEEEEEEEEEEEGDWGMKRFNSLLEEVVV